MGGSARLLRLVGSFCEALGHITQELQQAKAQLEEETGFGFLGRRCGGKALFSLFSDSRWWDWAVLSVPRLQSTTQFTCRFD